MRLYKGAMGMGEIYFKVLNRLEHPAVRETTTQVIKALCLSSMAAHDTGAKLHHEQPFTVELRDTGEVEVEWVYPDFRIGFSIAAEAENSGWFLIAHHRLGDLSASGRLDTERLQDVITWIVMFVALFSGGIDEAPC